MIRRAFLAFVALIALGQTAIAGVPLFGHVSCGVVRFYVSKYSEAAAEKWARANGAGEAEIETARRCLHPANVQTASAAVRSKPVAPIAGQERAKNEPAEVSPDQQASMQALRADPEQDKSADEPPSRGVTRAGNIEDRSVSYVSHKTKDVAPSDIKTTTLRPRHAGTTHRAQSRRPEWARTRQQKIEPKPDHDRRKA